MLANILSAQYISVFVFKCWDFGLVQQLSLNIGVKDANYHLPMIILT